MDTFDSDTKDQIYDTYEDEIDSYDTNTNDNDENSYDTSNKDSLKDTVYDTRDTGNKKGLVDSKIDPYDSILYPDYNPSDASKISDDDNNANGAVDPYDSIPYDEYTSYDTIGNGFQPSYKAPEFCEFDYGVSVKVWNMIING